MNIAYLAVIGIISMLILTIILYHYYGRRAHEAPLSPGLTPAMRAARRREALGGVYSWCGRVYDFGDQVAKLGFETGTPGIANFRTLSAPSSFEPLTLTCKPYGFPSSEGPLNQWKNSEKWWALQYAPSQLQTRIETVQPYRQNNHMSGSPAVTGAISEVSDNYYTDAERYCRHNPTAYPCPNFWVAQRGERSQMLQPDKTYTWPLPNGNFGHIKDRQIDDNYNTFVVKPGAEDEALCGNAACFRPDRPACSRQTTPASQLTN
jgi:hypothetical protein